GVGEAPAVAGERDPDLGGGAVAVVGQALDQDRHAVRAVSLVRHRLPVGTAGLLAGAALDRPVDVVVGYRVLLGLLDRVVQGRVAGRVAAADTGGHLDVLDQAGEELAALGVDDRLLVLGSRPLRVAGHYPSATRVCASRTSSTKRRCTRRSPASSGWKAVASRLPCRTATILPSAPSGT